MSVIVNRKGGEKGGLCSQHVHRLDSTKHDERKKAFLQCGWKRFWNGGWDKIAATTDDNIVVAINQNLGLM